MKKKKEINLEDDEILASVNKEPKGAKKKSKKKKGVDKKSTPTYDKTETRKKDKAKDMAKAKKKVKKVKKNKKVSKITKMKTEAEQKKERIRKRIAIFILIVLTVNIFLLSPIFNLKNINVNGNTRISTDEIISSSGIMYENSIFKINKNKITKNLKENSYIEDVRISRKIPSTINIDVIERKARFMLEFANAYVYINSQGYMLEIAEEKIEVPLITGFTTTTEEIVPGNRLCTEDLKRLQIVIEIIEVAKNNEIADLISKVDISDTSDYIVEFESEGKIAHFGDCATSKSNLNTKMLYVKELIQNYEKGIEGEIFVNMDLNSKKVYFKEKV